MKYMMFVVTDSNKDATPDDSDVEIWVDELDSKGKRLAGDVPQPPSAATVVRVRDGERLLTDGPFAESKEWICGFDILDVENLDEAIEIAATHPMSRNGQIELRPFMIWDS